MLVLLVAGITSDNHQLYLREQPLVTLMAAAPPHGADPRREGDEDHQVDDQEDRQEGRGGHELPKRERSHPKST